MDQIVTLPGGGPEPKLFRPPAPKPQKGPLGPFAMLATLRRNPIETWTEAHFEHFLLAGRTILGNTAVVSAPSAIRHILVENADNYRKDGLQRRILAPGLGDGLLTAQGETWRTQRRATAPLFSGKMIQSFAAPMAEAADALVARWSTHRDGAIIDVQKSMARVTLDTLQRTIIADGLAGYAPEEFAAALTDYFNAIGSLDPFDLLDMPAWLPRLSRLRSQKSFGFFDAAIDRILTRRRARLAKDPASVPRDLLTLLLEAQHPQDHDDFGSNRSKIMNVIDSNKSERHSREKPASTFSHPAPEGRGLTEEEVRANVITFIGAGHETTANALTWTLYLLSHAPEWQERLAQEAARASDGTDAQALIETRAVIEEAMRLYPPVASLSREAIGPDDVLGRRIRKGTLIMIVPWILHRHRLIWKDPELFDPRRFLPGEREKIDRFAYLPFGAGPRVCIGASFALQEAVIVLSRIVRNFRLKPVPYHAVWPLQRITLRPQGGMPLIVERRT